MQEIIQIITAFLGTFGFAALFNLRGKKLLIASLGGLFTWVIYVIVEKITANPYICGFFGSVALTLYAEIMARRYKTPVNVFLVSATIPLIPGSALYRTMECLMKQDIEGFAMESSYTLLFAASMSAGITVTTTVFRTMWKLRGKQRRI